MFTFSLIHFWIQRPRRLYFGDFTAQLAWNILGTEKNSKSKRRLSHFQPQIPTCRKRAHWLSFQLCFFRACIGIGVCFIVSSFGIFSRTVYLLLQQEMPEKVWYIQHSFQVINVTMCIVHAWHHVTTNHHKHKLRHFFPNLDARTSRDRLYQLCWFCDNLVVQICHWQCHSQFVNENWWWVL
jgi:hypothetical protein